MWKGIGMKRHEFTQLVSIFNYNMLSEINNLYWSRSRSYKQGERYDRSSPATLERHKQYNKCKKTPITTSFILYLASLISLFLFPKIGERVYKILLKPPQLALTVPTPLVHNLV